LNDRVEQFLIKKGVPLKKIIALPNGVDIDFFCPANDQDKINIRKKFNLSLSKKIVLFVGRFVPKKGFLKVLAARSDKYQIVLVGGDVPEQHSTDVIFFKQLPPEKLKLIYQTSDLFVLPSEGEGFPLTIQEAMASGLPIVSSDDKGYQRYNFDKKRIYLIDNPTDQSVRSVIEQIINDDLLLKDMSEYSKNYATIHFSWPRIISQLNDIYNNLLKA
jgi:glycosyltransferase involved in cell wall biosynthesis